MQGPMLHHVTWLNSRFYTTGAYVLCTAHGQSTREHCPETPSSDLRLLNAESHPAVLSLHVQSLSSYRDNEFSYGG